MAILTQTFTNADLNGAYQFEFLHNLSKAIVVPTWYDDSGIQQSTASIFQMIDTNNCTLNCNNTITGTHTLVLEYDAATPAIAGRRLFELGDTTPPADTNKLAFGEAGTPSINYSWANIKTLLFSGLDFLKKASNLSDLSSVTSARSNLSVYSKAQTDAIVAPKAELYQAGSGSAIGTANTATYTPTLDHHPCTKKYADEVVVSESLTISYASLNPALTVEFLSIWRSGDVVVMTGRIYASTSSSAYLNICQLDVAANYPPASRFSAAVSAYGGGGLEYIANVRVDASGILSIAPRRACPSAGGFPLVFNITYVRT